ncbi:A24 family peptidase [Porphyrobacter sp. LM 6]|uniref:A24 family peptidase n=1 Tax=Porphyrobacter sp. LM 6 TaxID=1896196 RepID=UPI00084737B5|nr:prepilin peptidase [Porphyrobacter sp. LM 6]AOL93198.1 prepilin peptidase CpaA [Porphyrobacter sp. LM 6]
MPPIELIELIGLGLLAGLAAYGSWTDISRRHLSNWLCLATLIGGLAFAAIGGDLSVFLSHLAHFGIALVIGIGLFAVKAWGGGDGKFYAAVASWIPLGSFFVLVLAISLVGLVMMMAMLVKHRGRLLRKDSPGVPYGVAIGLGGAIALGSIVL